MSFSLEKNIASFLSGKKMSGGGNGGNFFMFFIIILASLLIRAIIVQWSYNFIIPRLMYIHGRDMSHVRQITFLESLVLMLLVSSLLK
jgi:hypothetical protein